MDASECDVKNSRLNGVWQHAMESEEHANILRSSDPGSLRMALLLVLVPVRGSMHFCCISE